MTALCQFEGCGKREGYQFHDMKAHAEQCLGEHLPALTCHAFVAASHARVPEAKEVEREFARHYPAMLEAEYPAPPPAQQGCVSDNCRLRPTPPPGSVCNQALCTCPAPQGAGHLQGCMAITFHGGACNCVSEPHDKIQTGKKDRPADASSVGDGNDSGATVRASREIPSDPTIRQNAEPQGGEEVVMHRWPYEGWSECRGHDGNGEADGKSLEHAVATITRRKP